MTPAKIFRNWGYLVTSRPNRASFASADDRTLAGRAADGDIRAFEVLVRRYGPLLRTYAARIVGSSADIDDVVQETFITAWRQLPALENGAAVKGWLVTIATRKSIDRVRARRNHDDLDDHELPAPESDAPQRVAEARSRDEALTRALSALPPDQRRCWVLREVSEYSYEEIAGQLDMPISTVRGLLARARKTLVREMEAWR